MKLAPLMQEVAWQKVRLVLAWRHLLQTLVASVGGVRRAALPTAPGNRILHGAVVHSGLRAGALVGGLRHSLVPCNILMAKVLGAGARLP